MSPDTSLTAADVALLRRPLHGFRTVAAGNPVRAQDLAGILAEDQVRLVLHPDAVSRYAY